MDHVGRHAHATTVTPIPVEPDVGIGDPPIQVEPDGNGDTPGDHFPVDQARNDARGLLGRDEADLPADVRIAREGTEQFTLTEDYVLGRFTVELHDGGDGFRVRSVTVECLPAQRRSSSHPVDRSSTHPNSERRPGVGAHSTFDLVAKRSHMRQL